MILFFPARHHLKKTYLMPTKLLEPILDMAGKSESQSHPEI
jgi:hypothetical protein